MAVAYITTAQVNAQITSAKRAALFADDVADAFLNELIEQASVRVQAAAQRAGYTIGSSTTNEQIVNATMAVFLLMAYGRRDQTLPERFHPDLSLVDRLERGELALVGVTPDAGAGIGGAIFSEGDEDVDDDARFNPFRRDKMAGY